MKQGNKFTFDKKEPEKRILKTWTNEEDEKLIKLVKRFKSDWKQIASKFQDRNQNQCLHRYRRIKGVSNRKQIWTNQQDNKVIQLVCEHGKNWVQISKHIPKKTGKQIRERYINKLDPEIKQDDWTQEQDFLIIKLYNQIGSKWNQISKHLKGRPQNKVKNRFYSHIKRFYKTDTQIKSQREREGLRLDQQPQFIIPQLFYKHKKDSIFSRTLEPTQELFSMRRNSFQPVRHQHQNGQPALIRKQSQLPFPLLQISQQQIPFDQPSMGKRTSFFRPFDSQKYQDCDVQFVSMVLRSGYNLE